MNRTLTFDLTIPLPQIETPTESALWVVVAVALVADVVTTLVGLQAGITEANPVADTAITGWGLVGMLALKAGAVTVGLACRPFVAAGYRAVVPAALALPWSVAVLVNSCMIALVIHQ